MSDRSTRPPGPDEEGFEDEEAVHREARGSDVPRAEHSPLPTDLADDLFDDAPGAEARRARLEERRLRREAELGHPTAGGEGQADAGSEPIGDRVGEALGGIRERLAAAAGGRGSEPPDSSTTGERAAVDDWLEDSQSGGYAGRSRTAPAAAVGGGPSGPASEIMRRRAMALGGLAAVVVVIVIAIQAVGGDSEPLPPPEPVATFNVTIPEGLGRKQVAKVVKKAGVKGDYVKATKKAPKGFNPGKYGADDQPHLEGFLFPATYELEEGAKVKDLVSRQLAAFEDRMSQINLKKAKQKNLTAYDVVIIASMIEREVSIDSERRKVSAVIYNRLSTGEPLGIDSTTRYELDNYDEPLLESELAADTPYNTRLNAGLTPTPIGNPGLASLEAAAKPANSDVRFFVVEPYTCNEHVFTADPAEFQQAQAEYQAALAAEGGAPTSCPDGG